MIPTDYSKSYCQPVEYQCFILRNLESSDWNQKYEGYIHNIHDDINDGKSEWLKNWK